MDTKRCSACRAFKSLAEFYKGANQCKPCQKETLRKYRLSKKGRATLNRCRTRYLATPKGQAFRARHRIKRKEGDRTYRLSEHGKAYARNYYHSKLKGTPFLLARQAVYAAVRTGRLPRVKTLTCQCGKPAQHYHHHLGYAEEHRLHVIPICAICHKAADAKAKA